MKTLQIPVHSFVDLITNSSSEVFVCADRKTIEVFERAIDEVLRASGSNLKCSDAFEIYLSREDGGYGQYNTVNVRPKSAEFTDAAAALEKIRDAFTAETIGNG